ncbi:hypothetical protein Tco_0232779 [Tanacetum coccineum]
MGSRRSKEGRRLIVFLQRFRNGFSTGVVCGLDYLHNGKPPWWDVDRVRSFSRYLLEDKVTPSRFGDGKKNGKPPRWDVDQGFPCLSSLNMKADVWSGFEVYNNPLGRKTFRVTIGLESFSTYLLLVDPELIFSVVLRALEECKGVIEITLLIHGNVAVLLKQGSSIPSCVKGPPTTLNIVLQIELWWSKTMQCGCTVASPLALEYRNSDGDFDIRHHVFRYDRASYEFVFRNGFEARRQANTTDETYFNLERFVNISSGVVDHVYRYEIYAPGEIWVAETLGYYLVDLEVNNAWLSIDNMNPMPMLKRLEDPRIHLHNLKTCHWTVPNHVFSLTLITPKLGTLRLEFQKSTGLHVESPMLSHLHIDIDSASSFEVTEFEKLKTVQLKSINIRSLLDKFPLIDKVENLTVESRNLPSGTDGNSSFTLYHVFRDFPA